MRRRDGNLGSILHQVKSTMLVTLWVFIGIEGASVYSARAARRSDVGPRHIDWICRRARHLCSRFTSIDGHIEPAGTRRSEGSLDGGSVRAAGRYMGCSPHQPRPHDFRGRRVSVMDASVCGDSLYLRRATARFRDGSVWRTTTARQRMRCGRPTILIQFFLDPEFLLEERLSVLLLHRLGRDPAALRSFGRLCSKACLEWRGLWRR